MEIQKLTLGEVAKVEELGGISINEFGGNSVPQGKALAALAFVMKRREDNKFTFNDALNLTMDEAVEIIGINEEDDEPFGELDPKDD